MSQFSFLISPSRTIPHIGDALRQQRRVPSCHNPAGAYCGTGGTQGFVLPVHHVFPVHAPWAQDKSEAHPPPFSCPRDPKSRSYAQTPAPRTRGIAEGHPSDRSPNKRQHARHAPGVGRVPGEADACPGAELRRGQFPSCPNGEGCVLADTSARRQFHASDIAVPRLHAISNMPAVAGLQIGRIIRCCVSICLRIRLCVHFCPAPVLAARQRPGGKSSCGISASKKVDIDIRADRSFAARAARHVDRPSAAAHSTAAASRSTHAGSVQDRSDRCRPRR